jgi:hypothetical protein
VSEALQTQTVTVATARSASERIAATAASIMSDIEELATLAGSTTTAAMASSSIGLTSPPASPMAVANPHPDAAGGGQTNEPPPAAAVVHMPPPQAVDHAHGEAARPAAEVALAGCEGDTGLAPPPVPPPPPPMPGLAPGSTYVVRVLQGATLEAAQASDPTVARTLENGTRGLLVYRVSEYTNQLDFLENHDSASLEAQAAFLTDTNSGLFFNVSEDPPVARSEEMGVRAPGTRVGQFVT